jgi:hypothetical protein
MPRGDRACRTVAHALCQASPVHHDGGCGADGYVPYTETEASGHHFTISETGQGHGVERVRGP